MKIFLKTLIPILFFCLTVQLDATESQAPEKQPKLVIELFFRPNCSECRNVKQNILPELESEFADSCSFLKRDVSDKDNYLLLSAYLEFFNIAHNAPVYIVVGSNNLLAGTVEIRQQLRTCIISNLAHPVQSAFDYEKLQTSLLEKRARKFTLITVFIAGLIDGINPCVFATLVFFISLLATAKVSGGKILTVGGVYCFACFLTYFALGFGIFNFLHILSSYSLIRDILEWGTITILGIFAAISFVDAFRFKTTQKADRVLLQLPQNLKNRIHALMRRGVHRQFLLGGIFVLGILVTIIESACTGQVYIPTLVLLTRERGINVWLFYLLLYNLAFIVPLLIVFAIAYRGTSTLSFITWSKRHLVYSKIALGLLFLLMALFLLLIKSI